MKNLFILFTGLVLLGCKNEKKSPVIIAGEAIQVDSLPGQSPYLTTDGKGKTLLSWVRMLNDSSSVFCYATSADGGSFSVPAIIPGSENIQPHSENLPKIIVKPSGERIALWGTANPGAGNKYSGLVFYAQSFDEGKTWSRPRQLVSDTAGHDQRYYDVALLSNGEAGIIWLDNRKTTAKEGSALWFASTEGTNGFREGKLIAQPCCQCCRTDLFTDSKGGIHVLYRAILADSIRDIVHAVSLNNGQTFSAPQPISNDKWVINGCPHTGPAMTENNDGLHFAWFTGGPDKGCFYTSSADNGTHFTSRENISGSGSHPQIVSSPDGKLIVVWDETVRLHDTFYKGIAVQERKATGTSKKKIITPDTAISTYPVITLLGNGNFLVAYSKKKGDKNYITCQTINTP